MHSKKHFDAVWQDAVQHDGVVVYIGVEDFRIANVVGGVIAMMGFLNDSMSGATARFLSYEIGRGDQVRLKRNLSSRTRSMLASSRYCFTSLSFV